MDYSFLLLWLFGIADVLCLISGTNLIQFYKYGFEDSYQGLVRKHYAEYHENYPRQRFSRLVYVSWTVFILSLLTAATAAGFYIKCFA